MNIELVKKLLVMKKCQVLLLSDLDKSHRWLLGEKLEHALVLVFAHGKPSVVMSPLENFSSKDWNIIIPKNRDEQKKILDKLLDGVGAVAVSGSTCSLRLQKVIGNGKRLVDVESDLLKLRAVKNQSEVSKIKLANKLTTQCFHELVNNWCELSHENEAVRFIRQFALDNDVGLSFDPIVASGKNAAVPHHVLSTKLNSGFCVIDFGFDVDGYKADMTRTIYIGKPNNDTMLIYDKLLECQEAAVKMVKPDVKCSELHNFVVKSLGNDAKFFIHSLGHGVGLDIHEHPNLGPKSDAILCAGMVITIEPGIYDPARKLGIRIEDSLLVTQTGYHNLTKNATKALIIVK